MPKLELDYCELDCIIGALKAERRTHQRFLDDDRQRYAEEFADRDDLTDAERTRADCVCSSIDFDKINIRRYTALIAKLEVEQ